MFSQQSSYTDPEDVSVVDELRLAPLEVHLNAPVPRDDDLLPSLDPLNPLADAHNLPSDEVGVLPRSAGGDEDAPGGLLLGLVRD